jgi:hypothetical protein
MTTIDLAEFAPKTTSGGKKILLYKDKDKIILYTAVKGWSNGKWPKEITVKRFMTLDALTLEGLGLWEGEGGKNKGLYFGNSSQELVNHFLKFIEARLGISREKFKVTVNSPSTRADLREKWSKTLEIPLRNFTNVCLDERINFEYAQIYLNSVILVELMKNLGEKIRSTILSSKENTAAFLRGLFAAEGSVILKESGVLFHIDFSTKDLQAVQFYKDCLDRLGIKHGTYTIQDQKFQIYGWRNFKRFREFDIHTLHPEKRAKFELGFARYKRTNVLHGDEARALILQQLASGPKTYDELAAALDKARTTIQAWHVPILEREGKVKRIAKRGQAWLFGLAEGKSRAPAND